VTAHPQFDEDLDLYALGAMEAEEAREIESHLQTCPTCTQKLAAARARVAVLALAAPRLAAPAAGRDRLLHMVRATRPERAPAHLGGLWRRVAWSLALAVVVLAIVIGVFRVRNRDLARRAGELESALRQQRAEAARALAVLDVLTAPDTLRVTLVAGVAPPVPQGKAFYHSSKGLLFYATDLPVLTPKQTYQLWLVPIQGNPISAGIFQADAKGNGQVILPALPSAVTPKAFAVTVEPAGGVPQPTGPKVLVGLVS
jgi:anti-sigma-K factor RskA